ncbi:hypothetical protein CsSME_00004324 [Camellia sinensis var. sinensis]
MIRHGHAVMLICKKDRTQHAWDTFEIILLPVYYITQKLEDLVFLVVMNYLRDTLNNGFMQNIVIAANNTKFAHALVPHLTDK